MTNIQHDLAKDNYPEIKDGWYGASGGNFKFGARGHASIKSLSLIISIGKTFGQDFRANPTFPFFVELSVQKAF